MNPTFTSAVPFGISLLFLILIPIPVFLIALLGKKGAPTPQYNSVFWTILGFYGVYFTYVAVACFKGVFAEESLPPKILQVSTLPLLLFLTLVVFNLPICKKIVANIQTADLVRLHGFRLIGGFFIILAFYGAIPLTFALIAGLGDILTAITSVFVANAIETNKPYARKLTLVWNTFGFLDIICIAVMAFVLTKIAIETGAQGVDTLGQFPFCFIPAFAPPTILFLHLIIYLKI
ncbi:MAG: hypothetical protein U5L45_14190 [Saprospiraceae bacterium]|nr:hypothetical protein [Saprospiraceae bacterium]